MRIQATILALSLTGCGPNYDAVVRDICIPNNENKNFDMGKVSKEKGYDIKDVKSICRKWFQNDLKEFNDRVKQMNGGESDPYAQAD